MNSRRQISRQKRIQMEFANSQTTRTDSCSKLRVQTKGIDLLKEPSSSSPPQQEHMREEAESGQVEGLLAFLGGQQELFFRHLDVRVFGKLEVVDASHDRGKVVVGIVRVLDRLSDDGQRRVETLET